MEMSEIVTSRTGQFFWEGSEIERTKVLEQKELLKIWKNLSKYIQYISQFLNFCNFSNQSMIYTNIVNQIIHKILNVN